MAVPDDVTVVALRTPGSTELTFVLGEIFDFTAGASITINLDGGDIYLLDETGDPLQTEDDLFLLMEA